MLLIIKNEINISNITKHLDNKHVEYTVIESNNKILIPSECSGIILAGSNMHLYDQDWNLIFANLQAVVQGGILAKCPILGICFGMQIIATLFGGEVTKLKYPMRGGINVTLDPNSPLFDNTLSKIKGYFNNEDIVSKVPRGFKISGWVDGQRKAIAIQNKQNKIFGVQFHPEHDPVTMKIIDNFINICQKVQKDIPKIENEKLPKPIPKMEPIDYRPLIINKLNMYALEEKVKKQYFKAKAYSKVIHELEKLDKILTYDDILQVKGIGKSIAEKIKFIFDNPDIVLEKTEEIEAIEQLTKVYGIGPAKAKTLFMDHGIKTITDLKQNLNLLNAKQLIGINYVDEIEKRIPFKEMQKHELFLGKFFEKSVNWEIAGSYRRQKPDSGDIDVIVNSDTFSGSIDNLIDQLKSSGYVKEILANGEKKFMGICKLPKHRTHRRIDIMFTEQDKYPFAILYFTGSKEFNVNMRGIALSKGYSMNEYGLTSTKTQKAITNITSERQIFNFLGIPWAEPKDR